jgi:pimeloyl-ACP methyl ester carboxylesterase
MKMKLAQRLAIRYHITRIKTLGLISPRKAAEKAFELFCTPLPVRKSKQIPAVFEKAEKISFVYQDMTIRGYSWMPAEGNGRKVLILHGFSSNAYKFDKYVAPLLKSGFEVLIFDAPAHGISDGKLINALIYRNVILEAEKWFGPFFALIGHSLGGLAASLVFERFPDYFNRKLVLIAPATETTTAVENFFAVIPVAPAVREIFIGMIKEISGEDIPYFSVSRVARNIHAPVFWIHDTHDSICPIKDVQPVIKDAPKHIQFMITEKLGHSGIYKDQKVVKAVVDFLNR